MVDAPSALSLGVHKNTYMLMISGLMEIKALTFENLSVAEISLYGIEVLLNTMGASHRVLNG